MIDAIIAADPRRRDDTAAARDGADGRRRSSSARSRPNHILDMHAAPAHPARPRRARGRAGRAARDDRRARGDPRRRRASCAASSRTSSPRSARSSPTTARAEITFDPGDIDIEDLIDDEELVVTLSAKGYVKTVAADAFRTQGRGGRGVAGAKLRDEDYVAHILTTTAHSYLLFFSNRGPGLPAQGARDPDEGAHRARHRDRQPAAARSPTSTSRRSSTPATTRRAATCSSPPSKGQVKKTKFTEYDSSLRDRAHRHQPAATATSSCG